MAAQRYPDWPRRLDVMVKNTKELSFAWGFLDCALHVANCVKAITGVDPAAGYRGTYSDEASATAIFGSDLAAFAAGVFSGLDMPEVEVGFARRGDVVFVDNDTEFGALGVVGLDARFALCMGENGIAQVAMRRWKRAWQVG